MVFPKYFVYFLNLLAATILPALLAAGALGMAADLAEALHLGSTATAYQQLGGVPPFLLQSLLGLALGYSCFLAQGIEGKLAQWVWVIPAAWMLVGIATWQPVTSASNSVWEYFFSTQWLRLPPSPVRSHWVTAQFTHTLPLCTSLAYSMGALLRSRLEKATAPSS